MNKQIAPLVAGLVMATANLAHAEDAKIKSMSYSTTVVPGYDVINVYSSDGSQWDTLAGPSIRFMAHMELDTKWPGYIKEIGIFNGWCVDAGCFQRPAIYASGMSSRDINLLWELEIDMDEIPISSENGFATTPLGDEIVEECNNHLALNGATDLYVFNRNVWTSFSANTGKHIGTLPPAEVLLDEYGEYNFAGGDETRQDSFMVQVRCNPFIPDFDDEVPNEDFYIEEVELFLSTFSNEVTHPDPDTECRKGRILVRVTTNQAGPVAMHLWKTLPEWGSEYIETWSSHVGSGNYEAEVVRWVSVNETSLLQSMVEVENGYFDIQAGWEDLILECITDTPDLTIGGGPEDRPGREPPGDLRGG